MLLVTHNFLEDMALVGFRCRSSTQLRNMTAGWTAPTNLPPGRI